MARQTLTVQDFAGLLGHPESGLPLACLDAIAQGNWDYEWLDGQELDDLVTGLLDRIRRKDFSIAVVGEKTRWVNGWRGNLEQFMASGGDPEALVPKYVRPNAPVRLHRRFAQPVDPHFEQNWRRVYQQWLFHTCFDECASVYEFGCGSGGHVAVLAQMFRDKKIVGLDWAEPSCEIVNAMRTLRGWNTEGRVFDFRDPDYGIEIPDGSAVLTFAALEQMSDAFGPFLDFLLAKRPKLCVFIEPVYEWYDPANFVDHLAMRSHDLRNFLKGLRGRLRQLQRDGRIQILKEHRVEFGSLLHEGYSQIFWRTV